MILQTKVAFTAFIDQSDYEPLNLENGSSVNSGNLMPLKVLTRRSYIISLSS